MKIKWISRKFLLSLSGAVTGIILILSGSRTEGTGMVIAAILGYLAAEGYVDARAVRENMEKLSEAITDDSAF